MAGRVDQIQVVNLPVAGFVVQRRCLRFDGDAAFFLQIHGVEHLLTHFAVREAPTTLNKAIRQRGFAVINVGDDGEIADVLHTEKRKRPPGPTFEWIPLALRGYSVTDYEC